MKKSTVCASYKPKKDFMEVLLNCDDQVLVRLLLHKFVPDDAKEKIIDSFNATMIARDNEVRRGIA